MKLADKLRAKYEEPVRGAAFIAWTALTVALMALAIVLGQVMGNHIFRTHSAVMSNAN